MPERTHTRSATRLSSPWSPARSGAGATSMRTMSEVAVDQRESPPLAETPDIYGAYPRLSDDQIAALVEAGEVLVVPTERVRALVVHDPVLSDLILRAYLLRRSLLIREESGFRIIGSCYSPDTARLREFAARNRLPHRWIDLERDKHAERLLQRFGVSPQDAP